MDVSRCQHPTRGGTPSLDIEEHRYGGDIYREGKVGVGKLTSHHPFLSYMVGCIHRLLLTRVKEC